MSEIYFLFYVYINIRVYSLESSTFWYNLRVKWISTRVKSIVLLQKYFRDFPIFVMFILVWGPETSKKTKYNWNRYSRSRVINGVTNTVCYFLLYIQYRYSLRLMWISTRVKSIVFFRKLVLWLFEFLNVILLWGLRRIQKNKY